MASSPENTSMAVFCDFENVALGVRDAKYDKFDIKPVLERLLLKGSIVVKKSYCDWDRYKSFKAAMHEANFELIEIPHVRQSGKNSADIRLVVDALDLCYTKSHVNTFVIISGDSDFSPLVSKLRENAKQVIGVGVKQSTSDLLIANCDEFIFYDDLVRETRRAAAKRGRETNDTVAPQRRTPEEERHHKEDLDQRRTHAIDIALETFEALIAERGDSGKIWASMLKQAIKRRKPDFNENHYGFRTFGNLIEEAQARGLLEFGRDEKSGAYVYRASTERPASGNGPVHEIVREVVTGSSISMGESGPTSDIGQPVSGQVVTNENEKGNSDTPVEKATLPKRGARKPARQSARAVKTVKEKTVVQPADTAVSLPAIAVVTLEAESIGKVQETGQEALREALQPSSARKKASATSKPRKPKKDTQKARVASEAANEANGANES